MHSETNVISREDVLIGYKVDHRSIFIREFASHNKKNGAWLSVKFCWKFPNILTLSQKIINIQLLAFRGCGSKCEGTFYLDSLYKIVAHTLAVKILSGESQINSLIRSQHCFINDRVSSGNKPLTEPLLANINAAVWHD